MARKEYPTSLTMRTYNAELLNYKQGMWTYKQVAVHGRLVSRAQPGPGGLVRGVVSRAQPGEYWKSQTRATPARGPLTKHNNTVLKCQQIVRLYHLMAYTEDN